MASRPPRHNRASSVPSSPIRPSKVLTPNAAVTASSAQTSSSSPGAATTTPLPPPAFTPLVKTASTPTSVLHHNQQQRQQQHHTAPRQLDAGNDIAKRASFIQPRVAVALNVPRLWHLPLFVLRLCSILPAVWWGTPSLLQLVLHLLESVLRHKDHTAATAAAASAASASSASAAAASQYAGSHGGLFMPWTETGLAIIWCFASGYLSFFFTDCLMSRWLINYTPHATMVRLLTINAINAYVTSTVLSLAGGFQDLRLLLPGWIGIATTLTVCYHVTHQKINIRKETSTSINVFSIASYVSMIVLLAHMHTSTGDYPSIPLVVRANQLWDETLLRALRIRDSLEHYKEL